MSTRGSVTTEEGAALLSRLASAPWPRDAESAELRLRTEGMSLGPGSLFPGGTTGPVDGAPPEWAMTWFVSQSGFALSLFVAENAPLETNAIREAARAYESALDELMPRPSRRLIEPPRRGTVWWSGGAVLELDLIDSHERIGLVQVHLEGPDPKGAREPSAG